MKNKSIIPVLVCVFGMVFLNAQNFAISVNVSEVGGNENIYVLSAGFSPGATDGYDDGIDSYAPPPPPSSPPVFDAALIWESERYYTQVLAGDDDLVEHEYSITLAYPSTNTINFSWDNTGWSDMMSSCLLQDAFGGLLGIDIDMLNSTSLSLNNPAFNSLLFKVTPADFQSTNTAPSFTGGGDVTINEDAGEYDVEWATSISPGPTNENGQTLTFTLTTDNDDLFSALPVINTTGNFYPTSENLVFTTGENLHGTATVTVVLSDDGDTEDGGIDTSEPLEFTITVNSVNDPPSMTYPATTSVLMGSGPVTIAGWATNISPGPADESNQVVTADTASSNDATGYFEAMPILDIATGNLSFEWDSDYNGTGNMFLKLTDDGGTENGGDEDDNFNFTLESTPILTGFTYALNDLGVTFTNTTEYVGNIDSLTYEWIFGDGDTSFVEHPVHTYTVADTFTVSLTASDGIDSHTHLEDITVSSSSTEQTVTITNPADGSTLDSGDFSVEYTITNFTIGEAGCSDCDGHIHVLVDGSSGDPYGAYMVYEAGPISLSGVPNGGHSITVQLVDPSHQPFDPSIESTVTVTVSVSEPTVSITSPEDGSTHGSGDVLVEYATTDFTIGEQSCSDCDGHVHVLVDGSQGTPYGAYMVFSEGPISLSGVPDGAHSITIQLVDPSHQTFDPSIEATVNVTIDTTLNISSNNMPDLFNLFPNYPNPFNPITTFRYILPERAFITFTIFDIFGREITQMVSTTQDAGLKSVLWNAKDSMGRPVSAGVYLYQIQAGEFVQTKKMVLLK